MTCGARAGEHVDPPGASRPAGGRRGTLQWSGTVQGEMA
jgi:hypothetical protein